MATKVVATMTDLLHPTPQIGDADADAARKAKVEELQRRRAAKAEAPAAVTVPADSRGSARKGVGQGSKIAATAFGMTAMLGLVGAMGAAAQKGSNTTVPVPAAPAQVVVVLHPAATDPAAATGAATAGAPSVVPATAGQPIVLSAQPVVRQAPAAAAPAGKTSGSR
jgi:hypothetical protein